MSIGKAPPARPAKNYAEAYARFEALAASDGPQISAPGRSRLFVHGRRTERAVVLLHGLTNAPEQWVPFASGLEAAGDSIVIPRFPGHGYVDRATRDIAKVGAPEFLATVSEAVDIACGLGSRVTLAGLSVGGAMASWLAFCRADLAQTVAISPFIGVARCNEPVNQALAATLAALPNAFIPWDPGGNGSQIPPYAYADFPTRVLAACLTIGLDALRQSTSAAPFGTLHMVLNGREPACNNDLARQLAAGATRHRTGAVETVEWDDLPAIHDIIDPTNPQARTDIVYPRLRALIDSDTIESMKLRAP